VVFPAPFGPPMTMTSFIAMLWLDPDPVRLGRIMVQIF
jgi:hypothetical protein